jgi:carboxypeptidase C (cathepsin A)
MLNLKQYSLRLSFVFTLLVAAWLVQPVISYAQNKADAESHATKLKRILPADTTIITTHKVTVDGKTVPYKAIVGTMPVWGGQDSIPKAEVFYVYYKRTDVKNEDTRPIMISFNGGPGTGNLWMHLGYTSPVRLKVSENGWPVQPYGVVPNHHSILDVTDIVYISPVNTGYSRILNNGKPSDFFGVNEDTKYLSAWISSFVSRYNRWNSPKFIIGESYGTTRVSGLAGVLQDTQDMYLNGVILQGQCGMGERGSRWMRTALKLPYYTSTAWYFKKLPADLQSQDFKDIMAQVEKFTIHKYLPAAALGGSISETKEQKIAAQVAKYSGLSKQFVLNYNLLVPTSAFWKELLRDQGKMIGRLDSRYVGVDPTNGGARPSYSAEIAAWNHAFVPAINSYLRRDLNFKTNLAYKAWGNVRPWDRSNNHVWRQLEGAMLENPALRVLNQGGYYDGACDPFTAKYSLWHMDQSGTLQDRITIKEYQSGHMLYVRKKTMANGNNDIRQFIKNSIPKKGQPIKYKVNHVNLSGSK